MNNKQSKGEYLVDNISYCVLCFIWYKASLLRSLPHKSRADSVLCLLIMIGISLVIGIAAGWKNRRNNLSVFTNIALPFGLYTLITYYKVLPVLCTVVVIASVLLSLIFFLVILSRKIRNPRYSAQIIRSRVFHCLRGTKSIISIGLVVIVGFLGVNALLGNSLIHPKGGATTPVDSTEASNNADTTCIYKFEENAWTNLSSKQRATAMQDAADMQAQVLGLGHELNISLKALPEGLYGTYADTDHTISINVEIIDEAYDVLETIFHESYHAYQHRLCDAYDSVDEQYRNLEVFRNVRYYKEEFTDYTNGNDNFAEYYSQKCESFARDYAESNMNVVKDLIASHYNNTAPTQAES